MLTRNSSDKSQRAQSHTFLSARKHTLASYLATVCLAGPAVHSDAAQPSAATDERPPNLILMIADDLSFTDIGCYGSPNARTPNIDRLASQGARFEHCYNAIAMCVPTRNMLYTGLFPVRTGSYRNHTHSNPGTVSMVHYFNQLGYRVGLSGKVHVGPHESFPFEAVPGLTTETLSATDDYTLDGIKRFMTRDSRQPFFLVTAFIQPHMPWTMGDRTPFDPGKLKLPPHWADTPQTRAAYVRYLAEVSFLDRQVGDVLAAVDDAGLRENTIVIFLSEQGAQFPGAKWTCWEQGLHAGALIRWPGVVKPGTVSRALIQYVDFVPTLLDIARRQGCRAASSAKYDLDKLDLDGRSFINVLLGKIDEHGKYAYGIHNNHPEGPAYPIRSVRAKDFSYIRNLLPEERYVIKFMQLDPKQPYYPSWVKAAGQNNPRAAAAIRRNEFRPAEELYDLRNDPWEMSNLAKSPEHQAILKELRQALDEWMAQQHDTGAAMDVPLAMAK
jgi:uncharacterized sulfatase